MRFGCQLTGAFLRSSRLPNYLVSDGVAQISRDIVDGYAKQRKEGIEAVRQDAKEIFLGNTPSNLITRWLDIEVDTDEELLACAKRCDLIVAPPEIKRATVTM